MDSAAYNSALFELSQGRVPDNMDSVVDYANEGQFELRQLVPRLVECVKKQDRTIRLVRAMRDGLERRARETAPQFVGPSAEMMIPEGLRTGGRR